MTTPEQLQAWREEADKTWGTIASKYGTAYLFYVQGYLRAKQESEQAIKVDDHQIALLVNSVTHIAGAYHDHASLRQRMSNEIVPMFQIAALEVRKQALEDVAEGFIQQKSWLRDYAYAVVEHAAEEGATK